MATKTASTNQLDRSALARAVVNEGDLPAAGMLLDDLAQKGDPRAAKLSWLLGRLVMAALPGKGRESREPRRRSSSPEEAAHRTDEYHFHVWRDLARDFEHLFWVEIHGSPDLQTLKAAADSIQTPKQAQRLARDQNNSGEGEMMSDVNNARGSSPELGEAGW